MISGIGFPIRFVILMWLVFIADYILPMDLTVFGIVPRSEYGLIGILTSPLLHGSPLHIISNTIPMIVLGMVLFAFYKSVASRVFLFSYFITNILVWIVARPAIHIGASGLVYGIAFYLFFAGFFRKEFISIILSAVVFFFYGGIIFGVLPGQIGISWEAHLMGAIVGIFCAFRFKGGR